MAPSRRRETGHNAAAALAGMHRFAFLTLEGYSMIAFANALEVCRMANYVSGDAAYSWEVVTLDGAPARASNGLALEPTASLASSRPSDLLFVCGGVDVRHAVSRQLKQGLRRLARSGTALGGLCTGAFALAESDLLEGYRCAIHWENLSAIREEFPDIDFVEDLFVVDRDRLTCTGGTAPLDMMLVLVEARFGRTLAGKISDQFIVERVREPGDPQTLPLQRLAAGGHTLLARAVAAMRAHIEAPLGVADIAAAVGLSRRQLERQFQRHLGDGPAELYLALRLDRARELLRQTAMPVTEIGLASGFKSAAHFSTAYQRRFGHPPSAERSPRAL